MTTLGKIRLGLLCFRQNAHGGVAVWFGISAVMLLFFAGSGLDLARSINQQAEMQGAVDAAALAGAGAYTSSATLSTAIAAATNYMTQFQTTSGLTGLTFIVTPGTGTSGSSVSMYTMMVKASAPIANTLMAMAVKANTITTTATAQNPVYNITINMSGFSSSAIDTDTVSYYTVPTDGSTPTATTLLYSNATNATGSGTTTVQLTASQKLGFMLTNTTDGNAATTCTTVLIIFKQCTSNSYGNNAYGAVSGSVHYFYSHMMPPSKIAYPSLTQNCSLQVLTSSTATPTSGSCFGTLPVYATVNCVQASGMTLYYYWNDMGGTTDDKDYNDAVYKVSCSQVSNTVSKGLVLTN